MTGSAFNAFKARVPIEWSPRLYITLVRGLPGTRRLHRRTLEAMRLRRCNRTVIHRTTPSLLGEEVGCGGDRGDVQCPEGAGGGAPISPPSHRRQSSAPCCRSVMMAI
ncbi:uncharacterized protein LOC120103772 isoform X2 [Phoenix dactylifera]|uniref:Large ribosomal subunit protein uL30m n=1 Tax=Phoenix dactylifera TaxID=42345 RepID=A0A8B7BTM9_PHODC|nr:uncharacterized protein LOC103703818 isoform X2 [Phoenix dactylifera]XP_038982776.1 uncharacterized protein LOC120103772 isoform X2 [Phoenix dactylifera]